MDSTIGDIRDQLARRVVAINQRLLHLQAQAQELQAEKASLQAQVKQINDYLAANP